MAAGVPTDAWKTNLLDYLFSAHELFASMRAVGFKPDCRIPVDRNGDLLGGAHRLACAMAFGIKHVPVTVMPRDAWAPPWDASFLMHQSGFWEDEITRFLLYLSAMAYDP